jgi:hypothetical protein
MLERHYLQPLDGSYKENLHDGFIERIVHGAQHASQATLWALMMHNLMQRLSPDYVQLSLEIIAKHIEADVEVTLLFILMTMGCHDSARRGEANDLWEPQSAANTLETLKELGLEEKYAKLFAAAVKFKDKPAEFLNELLNLGIQKTDFNKFDYIRKIINLGDNLDLMRCVGSFRSIFIFNTLATVEGFNVSHHRIIEEFIKGIHQFTYDQQNMLFDCTVYDLKGNEVVSHQSNFSKKEKVKYEHAENVFAAIFEQALKSPIFEPLIKNFSIPKTKKYEGDLAFDPFIHGTNSAIFSILAKSKYKLMSPLEMMDEYKAAPMSGELTQGGYERIGNKTMKEGKMGKPSFGILSTNDKDAYTLEKIISNYANLNLSPHNPKDEHLARFKKELEIGLEWGFSRINLLLIYFTRASQIHDSLEQVISEKEYKLLQEQMEATSQFFHFIQLLGTYIHPNFDLIGQASINSDLGDTVYSNAVYKWLTFDNIVNNIIKNKINMKAIVTNPSQENLKQALTVLELDLNKSDCNLVNQDSELSKIQVFCLEAKYPPKLRTVINPNENTFTLMSQNHNSDHSINNMLREYVTKRLKPSFFIKMAKISKEYLIAFADRIRLLDDLINIPQNHFKLTALQNYFLQNKFPVIFVSENESKFSLYNFEKNEYRCNSQLELGSDIKVIATDNEEHRLMIMKYLDLNNLKNILVILFDDLRESKKSHNKSSSIYHHSDGIPTLKWLSAQKASEKGLTFFETKALAKKTPINLQEAGMNAGMNLFKTAEGYQTINFTEKVEESNTENRITTPY